MHDKPYIVLAVAEDECFVLLSGCEIHFESNDSERPNVDLLLLDEGVFERGTFKPIRRLNGDEAGIILQEGITVLHVKAFVYL